MWSTPLSNPTANIKSARLPKYRVLVIEDDRHIAQLISAALGRAGLEARDTHTGADGLDSFRDYPPHLVLLDLMMPVMDGFQVYEKIRSHSSVPIVIMSARLEPIQQLRDFRRGVDDFVLKPFDPQLLVARIIAHLRRIYRCDFQHIHRKEIGEPDEEALTVAAALTDSSTPKCNAHGGSTFSPTPSE